jgi:hypothetical protein
MSRTEELVKLTALFKPPCLLPRQKRTLWTKPYLVAPALVKRKFGKGDLLLGLSPIMHRPYYYLVWVDADWYEEMGDHIDDIWFGIEDEFGYRDSEDTAPYQWPTVDDDGGCHWWEADAGDVLTPKARKRLLSQAERTNQ